MKVIYFGRGAGEEIALSDVMSARRYKYLVVICKCGSPTRPGEFYF
jgi:hypothetical protein